MGAKRGTRNAERGTIWIVAAAWVLGFPVVAAAQAATPPRLVDVRVGFQGAYKPGLWTPVEVVLQGGSEKSAGAVVLTTADGDGMPVAYESPPLELEPGRNAATTVYVRFGSVAPSLGIVLRTAAGDALRETRGTSNGDGRPTLNAPLGDDRRLIIGIGPTTMLDELEFPTADDGSQRPHVVHVDDPATLPEHWIGYEGVDYVVIGADRTSRYEAFAADRKRVEALRRWVESGGKLLVVVGSEAERLFAPTGPLGRLLPLKIAGMSSLPRTAELEAAGGNKRLDLDAASLVEVRVPRLTETDGIVELAEGDLPLAVRRAVGFGRASLLLVDVEHPLLRRWPGRGPLVMRCLRSRDEDERRAAPTTANYYGYHDLAGQLRSAIDQYEGVESVSFFTLAVLVIGYLALVGPGDYLLVRRLLRRTEATWLTLPTIAAATAGAAFYLAQAMKGDALRTSRVEIVDCDAATGVVRGTAYAGVYAPASARYDVGLQAPTALLPSLRDVQIAASWFGLPGTGLGGMARRGDVAAGGSGVTYSTAPDGSRLQGVPIEVWSSKLLQFRWTGTAADLHAPLPMLGDRLGGMLRNPLATTLHDAWLYHGANAYAIGDLAPGATRELQSVPMRGVRSVLNDARVVSGTKPGQAPRSQTQTHDVGTQEIAAILREMLFFDAAGGRSHANLENRFQSFLDMSELLRLNRAVLTARIDEAEQFGTELVASAAGESIRRGADRRHLVVRLVIPVESPNASPAPRTSNDEQQP